FFFQAEDGIRDWSVTGVQTCALPILTAAALPLKAPTRGENGKAGNATTPGTLVANVEQQAYFAAVTAKVVLPLFKARNKPFVLRSEERRVGKEGRSGGAE